MKENIKAPRHWPLWGEFTGTGEFPAQRASNAENVSIWWRHHGIARDEYRSLKRRGTDLYKRLVSFFIDGYWLYKQSFSLASCLVIGSKITVEWVGKSTPFWELVHYSWWRYQMETFSALLVLGEGNSPVTEWFPSQRPETRSLAVFFDLRLNKRLGKPSRRRWFDTPSRSLWRHCNARMPFRQDISSHAIHWAGYTVHCLP